MPVYSSKSQNSTVPDKNRQRYAGSSADHLIKPHEEEQRIANAVLKDRIELKETPLSRMTGYKTSVVYYKNKLVERNDSLASAAGIGTLDPNKSNLIKIRDFIILCQGEISAQTDKQELGSEIVADGQAKVLPRTIKPMENDYFIMSTYGKLNLYRITNVTKTTLEDDSAYEISYQLVEESSDEKLSELERCVTEVYTFVYAHVGTSFRTLFKEDEYTALEKLDELRYVLGKLYNEYFYNKDKNTYILDFGTFLKRDVPKLPYSVALDPNEVSPSGSLIAAPTVYVNDQFDNWYGQLFYDRMLTEFILRNKLFTAVDKRIYHVTQLKQDLEKWYSGTLFYAVETQTIKRLRYKYLLPVLTSRVTVASTLNLYGVVSLEPMIEKVGETLDLYPMRLIPYILWEIKDRSITNISLNTYEDILELACETIGLFANKKDDVILPRLLMLYDNLDSFYDSSLRNQDTYYLFPLLAHVILKTMDRLSDPNFGLNVV